MVNTRRWAALVGLAVIVASMGLAGGPAAATDWAVTGGGDWSVPGNWTGTGTKPPNGIDQIASFAQDTPHGSDFVVTDASGTVGSLLLEDTAVAPPWNNYKGWVLRGSSLAIDVGSGNGLIHARDSIHLIQTPLVLMDDTDIVYTWVGYDQRFNIQRPISSGTGLTTDVHINQTNPSGSGSFGRVCFDSANTFNGDVTVHSNMLQVYHGQAIPDASDVTILAGASMRLLYNDTESINGLFGGGDAQMWSGTASHRATLDVGAAGGDGDFSGRIREEGATGYELSLTKSGAGTQILRGASTYHGTTTVNEGVLVITDPSALGSAATGTTVANYASLEVQGGITCAEPVSITGGGHPPSASWRGALRSIGGNNTWSGPIEVTGYSRIGVRTNETFTLTGGITGTGAPSLCGAANGTIRIADTPIDVGGSLYAIDATTTLLDVGGNSWGSNTTISYGGTLKLGVDDAMPAATVVGIGSTNNTSGTLDLHGHSQTLGGLRDYGTGSRRVVNSAAGTPTLTIDNTADYTFAGTLGNTGQDSFNLLKAGAGTQTLGGANTYSGTTTVSAGTLVLDDTSALGSGSSAIQLGDANTGAADVALLTGEWTLQPSPYAFTISRPINVSSLGTGKVTIGSDGAGASANYVVFSRSITMGRDLHLQGTNVDRTTFTNSITGTGDLYCDGPDRITFSGNNTYDGDLYITASMGQFQNGRAIPDTADVTISPGATLRIWGNVTEAIDGLFGSGIAQGGGGTLTRIEVGAGGGNGDYSGVIREESASYTLSLTKSGVGTQILRGVSTYSGDTTIAGGVLDVTGSIANSAVVIQPGATLTGTGTTGPVTVEGTLAPGSSPGILHTGSVDFSPAGTFSVELNGTTVESEYDQLDVTGSVALDGALDVALGFMPSLGDMFFIIRNDGDDPVEGTFDGLDDHASFYVPYGSDQQLFWISYFGDPVGQSITGGNDVVLVAVPEPATLSLLGLGGLFLAARRRRR